MAFEQVIEAYGDKLIGLGGGGSESAGHVIVDQSGTELAQEPNMTFVDAHLSDNSTDESTDIEIIQSVSESDWENVTEDGLYDVDIAGAEIGSASDEYVEVEADGNTTYGTLIGNIYTNADLTKIDENSYIMIDSELLRIDRKDTTEIYFTTSYIDSSEGFIRQVILRSNGAYTQRKLDNIFKSYTNDNAPDGTKITLYYGNKSAVIDLQTTANRCLYDVENEVTVKQKIDTLVTYEDFTFTQSDGATMTSGDVGSRGFQCSKDLSSYVAQGLTPISATIIYCTGSDGYHPLAILDVPTLYLNGYRTKTTAQSNCKTIVRVMFTK